MSPTAPLPASSTSNFTILDDNLARRQSHNGHSGALIDTDVLKELPVNQSPARTPQPAEATGALASPKARQQPSPDAKHLKGGWRSSRLRRPPIEPESFDALGVVAEETSGIAEEGASKPSSQLHTPNRADLVKEQCLLSGENKERQNALNNQVQKHLAGQFNWLILEPAGDDSANAGRSQQDRNARGLTGGVVYGCNLLPAIGSHTFNQTNSAHHSADSYKFLATELESDQYSRVTMEAANGNSSTVVISQGPPPPYPGTPSKVAEVAAKVEQAMSQRQTPKTVAEQPKGETSSPSTPRIEDSLAEIDELEDQLEALRAEAITRSGGASASKGTPQGTGQSTPSRTPAAATASKRASIVGSPATVRTNPTLKARPSLRRTSSLGEDKKPAAPTTHNKANGISKGQAATNRLSTPRNPIKSSKPVTVPNFELPGEAVARRLKEQREARQAQQTQEKKPSQPSPPKPRVTKSVTMPTFELPGEAISRRKREELQNRLRAQQEEEKKRREFKARPIRNSMGPTTLPRETLTSRIRQTKVPAEDKATTMAGKRMSMQLGRPSLPASTFPQARNRNSMIVTPGDNVSVGSSSKRSSISVEELTAQKQRVKSILSRNSSFGQDPGADKRQREQAAKAAREQAAERSRAASREWAEKKRQKEQAAKAGGAGLAA